MKNKKGVSEVIAAILLILLTVVAAAALIAFMKPFVEKSLGDATKCNAYNTYVSFEDKLDNGSAVNNYNCWQNENNYYLTGISLKTDNLNSDQLNRIKGFVIILKDDANNVTSFNISKGIKRVDLWNIEDKNANITFNGPMETMTYVYNASLKYSSAQVQVLLDSGICTSSDSITLNQCNGVSL
ncbi:MAG: archaellin/type IV pilin N-terminal domain-containing protein [archaeon]